MAMNSIVVILSFQLASSALLCPMHHCAMRTSATSFSCEQYPDEGYQCAGEGQTCQCAGMVKYGNFDQVSKAERWSAEKKVVDVIECTNTAMGGDPMSGAKVCWCRPDSPATTARSTCDTGDPSEDVAPTCIITAIKVAFTGMTAEMAYGIGYNEAVSNVLVGGIMDQFFDTSRTTGLSFDNTTLTALLRIPCGNADDCMALLDNPGAAGIKKTSDAFFDANAAALDKLAAFKTLISYEVPLTPRGSGPCVTPMTCGEVKEDYKKNKCCGADPAKPFTGSARRLTGKAKEGQEEAELLDSIRIALAKAKAEGGAATARKFAKTIAGIVDTHIQ